MSDCIEQTKNRCQSRHTTFRQQVKYSFLIHNRMDEKAGKQGVLDVVIQRKLVIYFANASRKIWSCSASCFSVDPVAGEADVGRPI